MRFHYDKKNWVSIEEGEKNCFLLTNGLGGYSSLSVIGSAARGDQALLMAAKKAPNVRWHLITNVVEELTIDQGSFLLSSQRMADGEDLEGFRYLTEFTFENTPQWIYRIGDVTVIKKMLMVHGENTVALSYEVHTEAAHEITLKLTPLLRFLPKKTDAGKEAVTAHEIVLESTGQGSYQMTSQEMTVFCYANGVMKQEPHSLFGRLYFSQDERDDREAYGVTVCNHSLEYALSDTQKQCYVVFSTQPHDDLLTDGYEQLASGQQAYIRSLLDMALVHSELGKQLAVSADAYIVDRESTQGKSMIAGYPFFEDWGRDTMIALAGATFTTGRFAECKSMLRTFAQYEKDGLLPNLFPEGGEEPMYNSVDAPLLFINAVYEYLTLSGDWAFLEEIWQVLVRIVTAYRTGTAYHIGMDTDGLIAAGDGLEQLTWMDVRVGDFLPTPRHGKPVEINAYWYNALCIMAQLSQKLPTAEDAAPYESLAAQVKASFLEKFRNEEEACLKDVLSGNKEENQVRCNQVWTLSLPFVMLDEEQAYQVLDKIRKELYTTVGLRTLSPKDADFHKIYIGSMQERDRAYHQGTVWAFPLGAYYRACLRYPVKHADSRIAQEWQKHVTEGMEALTEWLQEGCIAQIAEIYDGAEPSVSRGCFAQAWSVGELLRAVQDYENTVGI